MNPQQSVAAVALKTELDRPERPMRLFDLVDQMNAIDAQLDETGGEITPDIERALDGLTGKMSEKVESICKLRQNWLRSAESCEAEADRMKARAKSFRGRADSIKAFLHAAFVRWDVHQLKVPAFTVWRQKNPVSIRWTKDVAALPEEYRRVTVEPDLKKAKAALEAGEQLPDGFEIVQGEHLRIL